jgi:trehalose 6-phosphate synthase
LPVRRVKVRERQVWQASPGGLVSALVPVIQRAEGAWVGWTGSSTALRPFTHDGIFHVPVPITLPEARNFYQGFCNRTLWPLFHAAVRPPEYHRHWWSHYVVVNERFAGLIDRVTADGGTVWIQDYQLMMVPGMLRQRRPDLRIGFFLHIPFPPEELFVRLPWRRKILQGMLGADVVGFQTKSGARNFLSLIRRHTDSVRKGTTIHTPSGRTEVLAFPISIDFERFDAHARSPEVARLVKGVRRKVGENRKIILGVDRLDYTKGIDLRLKAYAELLGGLETGPRDSVLVQVAVPSREHIEEYKTLRRRVEELVGQINGEFGEVGVAAVHYLRRSLPFDELIGMYRAADVMLVTPFCDGMNLVAKEYVASRVDDTGVLILSEFAGAAEELTAAILVNPHDVDALAEAVHRGLNMPPKEQARRMRGLRKVVRNHTVHEWAGEFLGALEKSRP